MKKSQTKNTQENNKKSTSKNKETKESNRGKNNVSKKSSSEITPAKVVSNTNISITSNFPKKAGYSSVSKEKSSGKQAKLDNLLSNKVGNRTENKSPEFLEKNELKLEKINSSNKRRDAIKVADEKKIRNLSKKVSKENLNKFTDSSVKESGKTKTKLIISKREGNEKVF